MGRGASRSPQEESATQDDVPGAGHHASTAVAAARRVPDVAFGAGRVSTMSSENQDIFASKPPGDAPDENPFGSILSKSRNLMCERLEDAVAAMLDGAHEMLTNLLLDTYDRELRCLYEEVRDVATKQREVIEDNFRAYYLADFQRRCEQARKIGRPEKIDDFSLDDLELVGEEDLEETLRFNDMANKLRAYCEDELNALDQRVGVLLGDANLETKDNPFSPNTICDAFKLACRKLDVDLKKRQVLLKLFDDGVLDDIRSVYKAVNALLVRHSILPQIRFGLARKAENSPAPAIPTLPGEPSEAALAPGASSANIAAPGGQDLFALLQNLVAANVVNVARAHPASVPVVGGIVPAVVGQGTSLGTGGHVYGIAAPVGTPAVVAPALQPADPGSFPTLDALDPHPQPVPPQAVNGVLPGTPLLATLTRIQQGDLQGIETPGRLVEVVAAGTQAGVAPTNVLHEIKASSVGAGMGQLDAMTLDIIAMLFDVLFDDPKVPTGIKGLIGRLQIPVLKVAIADKTFFSHKSHPARQLLDAVGEVAMRLPADFGDSSPLFARVETIIQSLVEGFDEDLAIFGEVRERLLALIAEEDKRIEAHTEEEARRVEALENLSFSRSVAEMEVQARLQGRDVPGAVTDFLAQQWIKLLLLVHIKEGIESEAWAQGLETVDQLLWSIEPKATLDERRQLASIVPKLVRQLTDGLRKANIDDAVRLEFFGELMKLHTKVISAAAASANAPLQTSMQPAVAASAAAAAQSGQASSSLDFTAPLTVQNPFGEGEVKVDPLNLDFTSEAAAGARARREASVRRALENLQMGEWMEFRDPDDESVRKAGRLIFISPRKTRYLFAVDRAGKEIIECSRAEITRRLRAGEAVKLDEPPEESLFDRIMHGVMSKLKLPVRIPSLVGQH
jgi:hypothetical protein